jgi:hypothetical protein
MEGNYGYGIQLSEGAHRKTMLDALPAQQAPEQIMGAKTHLP